MICDIRVPNIISQHVLDENSVTEFQMSEYLPDGYSISEYQKHSSEHLRDGYLTFGCPTLISELALY